MKIQNEFCDIIYPYSVKGVMKKFIISTLIAMSSFAAKAEFMDGNMLYSRLTSSDVGDKLLGVGYVMGVTDTLMTIKVCPPANMIAKQAVKQAVDMVVQFLERNPKSRTNTADVIVGHVLSTAWPCEPSSRRQSSGGRST